jgi:HK97 family phage portal protein
MGWLKDYRARRAEKAFRAAHAEIYPYELTQGMQAPVLMPEGLNALGAHVWVYACVTRVAQACSRVPIDIMKPGKEPVPAELSDPVAYPFLAVNPFMSQAGLIESTVINLLLTGNAYWDLERDAGEIWSLRPDAVKVVPSYEDFVLGYLYKNGGVTIRFEADEIIHFKLPNPTDYWYGLSPLRAAFDSVSQDMAAIKASREFQERGAVPAGILSTPNSVAPDQVDKLRSQWHSLYGGPKGRSRVAVLQGGLTFSTVTMSAKDAETIAQRKISREEICAVFATPPALVGLFEFASYANADAQERMFWRNTVTPHMDRIIGQLNDSGILPTGYTAALDLTGLEGLTSLTTPKEQAENARGRVAALDQAVRAGVPVTVAEFREAAGLPAETPEGDLVEPPAAPAPVNPFGPQQPDDDQEPPKEPVPEQLRQPKAAPLFVIKGLKAKRAQGVPTSLMAELWLPFMLGIKPGLLSMQDSVLRRLAGVGIKAGAPERIKASVDSVDAAIDAGLMEDAQRLLDVAEPQMQLTLASALDIVARHTGLTEADPHSDRAEDWVMRRANRFALGENGGSSVPRTIHDRLKVSLADGLRLEESNTELTQRVMRVFDDTGCALTPRSRVHRDWPDHAQLIANEETKAGGRFAGYETAREAGLKTKTWQHSPASAIPRPEHEDMDGETVGIDEPYSNGMQHPGDGDAIDTINCECWEEFGGGE